ncbi:MAG: oligosaccharide flippase family protein [Thermodesulfobacteriota bacterium]|nr:oligosaccharide flippase family protein [Thermodesulfobacteriota bacterium]
MKLDAEITKEIYSRFKIKREMVFQGIREFSLVIGENTLELVAYLLAMVLIERALGQEGLGVYSYLLSLFMIGGYVTEFGVPRYVEQEIPLNKAREEDIVKDAFQATIMLGLLCVGLFLLTGAYDAAHTRVQEKAAAYLIIGMSIPFRNLNRLKMAILHGQGRHDDVAKVETYKRLAFLGAIFVLLLFRVPASYLVISFLTTELFALVLAVKKAPMPPIKAAWKNRQRLCHTLKKTQQFLFTDDAFDMVLYADFLVLGLYVTSWELGVYAEASILARFFLIVPMSIRPIFRHRYCVLSAEAASSEISNTLHRATAILFYLHSILALYILLYFVPILQTFFHTRGETLIAYKLFIVIVPGLLFYSSVMPSDAMYECQNSIQSLRSVIVAIAVVNLGLNFYLVPFAGVFGAATATMVSMLLYFLLFGLKLAQPYRPEKTSYLLAGGCVYLTYVLIHFVDAGWALSLCLVPVVLFVLLFFMGFFNLKHHTPATMSGGHGTNLLGEG